LTCPKAVSRWLSIPPHQKILCQWVMSHMNESYHTHRNESCLIRTNNEKAVDRWLSIPPHPNILFQWVMSHMNESYHTCMNESCLIRTNN